MNELQQSLQNKLQELLNERFSGESPSKRKIMTNYKGDELICSCPLCGDSSKDVFKKRLHIYTSSMAAKCYNCGFWGSVRQLFYKCKHPLDSKFGKLADSIFKDNLQQRTSIIDKSNINGSNDLISAINKARNVLFDIAFPIQSLLSKGFMPLDRDEESASYMLNRGYKYMDPHYKNLIIYDAKIKGPSQLNVVCKGIEMKVLNLNTRSLDDNIKSRYSFTSLQKLCPFMTAESRMTMDIYNKYILSNNILNVDFNKVITCCEGFFDAAFLDNSISSGGVSNISNVTDIFKDSQEHIRFLLDDDDAGTQTTLSLIRQGYTVFSWREYKEWAMCDLKLDLSKCKDITDIVKIAMSYGDDIVNICIDKLQDPNMYSSSALDTMKDMLFR